MPHGYTGKTLHVHLDSRSWEIEEQNEAFYRSHLGGSGLGYHHLLRDVPKGIDPFEPENLLILATGVMTGAPLPASCRFAAVGKSPLTGTAGESEAAGFFGPELKKAGFDAVVFRGRSEIPVYLWLCDGAVEIRDATTLAGLGAREVEDSIRSELGSDKIRVAQTGPAGMNRVRYANITNNLGHFNGRNGMGALMGAKNIRAVAVLGRGRIEPADPDYLKQTAGEYARTFRDHPAGDLLYEYGTTAFAEILSAGGGLPVNNFRRSRLEDATSVSGETYNQLLLKKRKGCHACPIRCKRVVALDDPVYGLDSRYGGPEYETIAALGTNLGITDLRAVAKGNEICNRNCMDTISAGMTIAFACECYEEKLIGKEDTGGVELRFGDAGLMLRLLEMTARRQGFGDLLAEGTSRLAHRWGLSDSPFNLTVKGMELPMHDPRVKVGVGLGYAVCTYGADHMIAAHDPAFVDADSFSFRSAKSLGIYDPVPATDISIVKIRNYCKLERFWKAVDALGLCLFGFAPRGVMPINQMVDCLNAVTGWDASLVELMAAGERSLMMARAFNYREGFRARDDRLPARLFDPKPDGPDAGRRIFSQEDLNRAVQHYRGMIGCNSQTGRPRSGKLMELGLEWVDDLLPQ